jgi:hypothetical protein
VLKRTDSIPVKDRQDAQGRYRPTPDPKPGHARRRILRDCRSTCRRRPSARPGSRATCCWARACCLPWCWRWPPSAARRSRSTAGSGLKPPAAWRARSAAPRGAPCGRGPPPMTDRDAAC